MMVSSRDDQSDHTRRSFAPPSFLPSLLPSFLPSFLSSLTKRENLLLDRSRRIRRGEDRFHSLSPIDTVGKRSQFYHCDGDQRRFRPSPLRVTILTQLIIHDSRFTSISRIYRLSRCVEARETKGLDLGI